MPADSHAQAVFSASLARYGGAMPRLRTLQQMLDRTRREAQIRGAVHFTDADLTEALNDAYGEFWEQLSRGDEGYGVASATLSGTAGQSWIALPADFLDLQLLERGDGAAGGPPWYSVVRSSRIERATKTAYGRELHRPGVYWLEGPGADPATDPQRVELDPEPADAEPLRLIYTLQSPIWTTLGSSLDMFALEMERAVIDLAMPSVLARDDARMVAAAEARRQMAKETIDRWRGRRDARGPDLVSHHQDGRWYY